MYNTLGNKRVRATHLGYKRVNPTHLGNKQPIFSVSRILHTNSDIIYDNKSNSAQNQYKPLGLNLPKSSKKNSGLEKR